MPGDGTADDFGDLFREAYERSRELRTQAVESRRMAAELRQEVAEGRGRSIAARTRAAERRQADADDRVRDVQQRASKLRQRQLAEQRRATLVGVGRAEERQNEADDRDHVANQRERAADERDRLAGERDRVADERDRAADERDQAADERDRVADNRDQLADERDRAADQFQQTVDRLLASRDRMRSTTSDPRGRFSEARSADVVTASFADASDARLRQMLSSLVQHLHAFVKDVELTEREWGVAIDFLTRTGHMCDDRRQEFILLSDVLGVSMLVETINHRSGGTSTESTVLGPFHMVASPPRRLGDNIALDGKGTPCLVAGQITGPDQEPVPGALVDVWQANADGFYDVQQPGTQPESNLRGLFTADDQGRFWFRSILPRFYPIPDDGPVGELLAATGRHPYRPAHLHFIVEAAGYQPVTTHVFVADSPYLDSDAVFGVKDSLIREATEVDDHARAIEAGLPNPFRSLTFDPVLRRSTPQP